MSRDGATAPQEVAEAAVLRMQGKSSGNAPEQRCARGNVVVLDREGGGGETFTNAQATREDAFEHVELER